MKLQKYKKLLKDNGIDIKKINKLVAKYAPKIVKNYILSDKLSKISPVFVSQAPSLQAIQKVREWFDKILSLTGAYDIAHPLQLRKEPSDTKRSQLIEDREKKMKEIQKILPFTHGDLLNLCDTFDDIIKLNKDLAEQKKLVTKKKISTQFYDQNIVNELLSKLLDIIDKKVNPNHGAKVNAGEKAYKDKAYKIVAEIGKHHLILPPNYTPEKVRSRIHQYHLSL